MLKVTADSYESARDCPFRNVLDKVGNKWSFMIFAVLEDGSKRFNEIKRLIGDISQRVLTESLRDLERDGYIVRTVYPDRPPKVVYELTDLGRSLLTPIRQFMNWAVEAHPQIQSARKKYDRGNPPGSDAG
jgi:DNA-binding HxlR family transcriptional regulator